VLVFKQSLCVSLTRWLERCTIFFPVFQWCCSSLSEVWQFEFVYFPQVLENSSVAHWPSCFGVGFLLCWFTGGLFLCLITFLWGKVSDASASPWCQCVVMVCWLFFNFSVSFDFECCSLAQEMSYVDHYLPYFRQWFITCPLLALVTWLSSLCLLNVWMEISSLPFPPSLVCLQYSVPSAVCSFLVPCLLCSFFFFCRVGGQSVQRLYWFIPRVAVQHLVLTCWSARCLPNRSGDAGALLFFSVIWHGEVSYGLRFSVSKFWFFLVLYFCQVWLQCLRKIFYLQSSHCLLLYSSHHLGSPTPFL
jgi:hypothetical protein